MSMIRKQLLTLKNEMDNCLLPTFSQQIFEQCTQNAHALSYLQLVHAVSHDVKQSNKGGKNQMSANKKKTHALHQCGDKKN